MDTATLITGLIALFLCLLPFIFSIRHRRKSRQALQHQLVQWAARHDRQLGYFEQFNRTALGFATDESMLFYVNTGKLPQQSALPIRDIAACRVQVTKSGKGKTEVTRSIALQFRLNSKTELIEWPFYHFEADPVMQSGELEMAMTWEKRISDLLPVR